MSNTEVFAIISESARAAWAVLSCEEAIATYQAKVEVDIYATYQAVLWAANAAFELGGLVRQFADEFVYASILALPETVEVCEAELIDEEPSPVRLLAPATTVIESVMRQRAAFKKYVLEVTRQNVQASTLRDLKRALGLRSSCRIKKAKAVALICGG